MVKILCNFAHTDFVYLVFEITHCGCNTMQIECLFFFTLNDSDVTFNLIVGIGLLLQNSM